jgi:hypothetical protein
MIKIAELYFSPNRLQVPLRSLLALAIFSSLVLAPVVGQLPQGAASEPVQSQPAEGFSAQNAAKHVRELSDGIGRRVSGTRGEQRAADYIRQELTRLGYSPTTQSFRLPNGRVSQNVIAQKLGSFHPKRRLVIGAHMDTKGRSPGANDNASGVAAMLELARVLKDRDTLLAIDFVAFGAEEMIDRNKDHHHYGSRYFISSLGADERRQIVGMLSVDMVGVGNSLYVRSLGRIPLTFVEEVLKAGRELGAKVSFLKGGEWSDHEAFEKAGIPAAWVEYRTDPYNHTRRDTGNRVGLAQLQTAGDMVLRFVTTYWR